MTLKKVRVLIVDDSSIVRKLLSKILGDDSEIEVVGTAHDPYVAREKIVALKPDVVTLDIEMPRMDGITFLQKLMQHFPIPTIIISSLSQKGNQLYMKALEYGAVDVIAKPAIDVQKNLNEQGRDIIKSVKVASKAKVKALVSLSDVCRTQKPLEKTTDQIIFIASSTGGTVALSKILPLFPPNGPGIVIAQHLPPGFTTSFAKRLNEICPFSVKEIEDGDRILAGHAYLVPGDYHAIAGRSGARYFLKLHQDPPLHGVRPAADILFFSVAKSVGSNAIGIVLTGMGKDGAEGLRAMKEAGAFNIAQDEASCVVFGMPGAAVSLGAIDKTLALSDIPQCVISLIKKHADR